MLPLFYDPIYTEGIDPTARFPRDRYRLLLDRLIGRSDIEIRRPRLATREELVLAHAPTYIDQFIEGRLPDEAIRRIGLRPWTPAIIERTLRLTGGSLQALEHLLQHGGISGNMAGGTHHAHHDFGSGYCIVNDLAICALNALKAPKIKRVLILDLDVHQGDGTAAICRDHPAIFTCSIHCQSNFPFRKHKSNLDVPLADHVGDDDYLECLDQTLDALRPENYDLILFQAGVDALAEDALGRLSLTRDGLKRRNERVMDFHERHGIPIALFMGGGYANPITPTVDAFEDLFTAAAKSQQNRGRSLPTSR
ncbi:MAG: acetoin utilization deacetylase AcuC-like enzyme [Akkermansiaceae bacterium]|jgi:acetoin utilization deacetylase AcuC-like enzyme